MELEIQKFIRQNYNWEKLLQYPPYNLLIRREENLVLFKYNQLTSDFSEPIVCECRGIILNDETVEVVCYPFEKFFNYGEPYADEVDWTTARIQAKIDGSLIKVWFDRAKSAWRVSTNGAIDAYSRPLDINELTRETLNCPYKTFGDLFDAAAQNSGLDFSKLDKNVTYMFELVSPYNRVVICYDRPEIWHIGSRNVKTFEELDVDIGAQKPEEYKFASLKDCIEGAKALSDDEEGYVVVDAFWRRVKVKNPKYLLLHGAASGGQITYDYLARLVRDCEESEFLSYFPEYTRAVEKIKDRLSRLNSYTATTGALLHAFADDRKQYAAKVFEYDPDNSDYYFKLLSTPGLTFEKYWSKYVPSERLCKAIGLTNDKK